MTSGGWTMMYRNLFSILAIIGFLALATPAAAGTPDADAPHGTNSSPVVGGDAIVTLSKTFTEDCLPCQDDSHRPWSG